MYDLFYLLTGGCILGIGWLGYRGIRQANPVLTANAIVAILAAVVPISLDFVIGPVVGWTIELGAVLPAWIAIGGLLHTIGMTTVYESIWWWDHLTHTTTAALIAAVVYAMVLMVEPDLETSVVAGITIGLTFLAGVFWELIELFGRDLSEVVDAEPLLVPYGRRDTILDLVFDLVGAILVVAFDVRVFTEVMRRHEMVMESLLIAFGGIVTLGSALLGLLIIAYRVKKST